MQVFPHRRFGFKRLDANPCNATPVAPVVEGLHLLAHPKHGAHSPDLVLAGLNDDHLVEFFGLGSNVSLVSSLILTSKLGRTSVARTDVIITHFILGHSVCSLLYNRIIAHIGQVSTEYFPGYNASTAPGYHGRYSYTWTRAGRAVGCFKTLRNRH